MENKAVNALSRVSPTMDLYSLSTTNIVDLETIKKEVKKDPKLQKIVAEMSGSTEATEGKFSIQHGMWKYKNRLVISKSSVLIPTILHIYHDSVLEGHLGFLRTYKRLTAELYWEGMKTDVEKYCDECLVSKK